MAKRKFELSFQVHVDLEIDDSVIQSVLETDWRQQFYDHIRTPEQVAEHVVFNMLQGRSLSSLDGFADQSDDAAQLLLPDWVLDEIKEVT